MIFVKWFDNLRVASCELRVASYDFKKINLRVASSFLQVEKKFYELEIYFASWKQNYKLQVVFVSNKLLFTSCNFREIILRVASCVLRVQNLKIFFTSSDFCFTSWNFKMILFMGCEVVFYKLTIQNANVTLSITCLNQISWE